MNGMWAPFRVLHVLDHSVPLHSGYAFRTLAILREQRALGWETAQVTSTKHTGASRAIEEVEGFTFHRTLPSGTRRERLPLLNQLAVVQQLSRRLRDVTEEFKPSVLHAHSPSLNGLAALRVARVAAIPVVYEVRSLWEDGAVDQRRIRQGGPLYRLYRALETYVLRRVDAITTLCEGLRGEIVARGVPGGRVTVVPNAVDTGRFGPNVPRDHDLAKELGLDGMRVVAFIGSYNSWEGLPLLIQSLPRLLATMPAIRLLLVGEGPEEPALLRQVQQAGLVDKVVFAGRVAHERIPAYYDVAEVLVYPRPRIRLTELVTPLKPLEAMARGRLVVASDVGGHRELVRHGDTGLMFRAGSANELADVVLGILDDRERAAAIAVRARRFVETERTWAASVARYAPIYESLVQPSGPVHA